MIRSWIQTLPVFIYKRIARRWACRTTVSNVVFAGPAKDILIRVKP